MHALMSKFRRESLVAATTLLAFGVLTAASADQYIVKDLGTLNGFDSAAFAINNFGVVVGTSSTSSAHYHAFGWEESLFEMSPLAGDLQSHAYAIDDNGVVAAVSYDLGEMATRGFLWDNGNVTPLNGIAPNGMNDSGFVVGYLLRFESEFGWTERAALWHDGMLFDLGTLGGHFSYAHAINESGQVAGLSFLTNDMSTRATLWQGSQVIDLGTLGGTQSQAYDINDHGDVVGVADTAAGTAHAFLFMTDQDGNVTSRTDLGELGGGYSYAQAVNNSAVVVGTSDWRAFIWENGAISDLNAQLLNADGWLLNAAMAIDDHGRIAGFGQHDGQPRAFLLQPTPLGDMNCDGALDGADIDPFFLALGDESLYRSTYPECDPLLGDVNQDGNFDGADIDAFFNCLGGNCP